MKHFKFTVASDRFSGATLVFSWVRDQVIPWPTLYSRAAYEVGRGCRCRRCHNCEIFELLANLQVELWNQNR